MSVVATIVDGFQNLVANLGTTRDKSYGNDYAFVPLTQAQIETAYRTSPIARKVVDMPAEDAAREWREWQAQADQIAAIEAEEKRLGLQAKLIKAAKVARMSGGAGIYIGVKGSVDPSLPLIPASVARGGLEYITVLSRWQLTEGPLQNDPRRPGFGQPEYYTMSAGDKVGVRIHPSRLVILRGNEMPAAAITTFDSWGDSVLQGNLETILRLDAALANVAALVFEAKVDVIKIKGFTDNLRSGGAAYEALMLRRFGLAATAKGINGALLLDSEEDYQQKSANFATLPDILDRFMQQVAGAADMPMTLLFGTSPGGLNATGDSDTRGYYDRVKTVQTLDIEPAMAVLDNCLIRSALGARPADVHYVWRPLWQPTAKEKAEVGKIMADTMTAARNIGLAEEVVGKALINGLTENGAFPGLEGYAEDHYGPAGFAPEDDPAEVVAAMVPSAKPNGEDPDPEVAKA